MDPAPGRRGLNPPPPPPADALVAWRYWQVAPVTSRLRSVSHRRFDWVPGRALRAACVGGGHPAPAEGCSCGVHGSRDLDTLRAHGLCLAPRQPLVVGEVALWGRVVPDGDGWRAEWGYPRSLALVVDTVAGEALPALVGHLRAYGVPVDTTSLSSAVGDVSAALLAFQAMSGGPA